MGMVVAAHHIVLDQPVAVKLLYNNDDEEAVSRLIMEAKSAARIPGEHVSRVLDIDRGADGVPFIVMELLEGVDLYQVLSAQGPLPRWLVVDYMLQALMGLAGAHARGIVHRDLKPSNLFLSRRSDGSEIIKVLDFGVSKSIVASEDEQRLTGAKAMLGSPPYMSPEQVRSPKTVDMRADIWAMGIVMYELLTARLPFRGQEVQETFAMILEREPPRLRDIAPEVPAGLEDAIKKCLTKNRDERYQSVHELATALVAFGSGTWTHAAEEVRRTLTRPLPEDGNASRSKPGALVSVRESDVQPTASTVVGKRKFAVANEGSRTPFWIAGGIGVAMAIALVVVINKKRHDADVAVDDTATSPTQGAVPMQAVPLAPLAPTGMEPVPNSLGPLVQTGQAPGSVTPLVQTGQTPVGVVDLDGDAGPRGVPNVAVAARPALAAPQQAPQSAPQAAPVRKVKGGGASPPKANPPGGAPPRGGSPGANGGNGGSLPDVLMEQK